MNNIITEKNYPIERRWVYKALLGWIPIFIILVLLTLPSIILKAEDTTTMFSLPLYIFFALGHITVLALQRVNFHYTLEDKFMVLSQGILSKKQRNIPYGVIQNVLVKQSLADRLLGLASLSIENAAVGAGAQTGNYKVFGITMNAQSRQQVETVGFVGNQVSIPGLSKQNAETLKNIILQKMKENPVEDSQSGL